MKYTADQKIQLKNKRMGGFTKHNIPVKPITIKDGFYIIESKMN